MDKFWNYFPSEQKFNVFLGEEYCNYDQSPEALRHRVHNKESLSEISQDLLDLAIFSRNNLIKTVEEFGKNISLNFSCYTPILENKRFQAIINMNMFLPLEREFHEKLHPIFPFSEPDMLLLTCLKKNEMSIIKTKQKQPEQKKKQINYHFIEF